MRKPGFDQMIYYVRERDKSAELVVTHQPKVRDPSAEGFWDLSAELAHRFGSGPGIRTLNLAVNRSTQPVQKSRVEFAECRGVAPNIVACHLRRCTTWAL